MVAPHREKPLPAHLEGVTLNQLARRTVLVFGACLALAFGLAACGGNDNNNTTGSAAATTSTGGAATSTSTARPKVDKAAAEAAIEPYIGKPSAFPVTERLKKVPKGSTIAFSDCGT